MPVKCPSCNLLFGTRNELDWHVREEHTRSRLSARTPPADEATPAGRTAPARASPDDQPLSSDPSDPNPAGMAPGSQRGRVRRLLRRSRTNPRPANSSAPPPSDERP